MPSRRRRAWAQPRHRFKWPADGRGAWPCLAICLSAGGMRSNDRRDRHLVGQLASDRLEPHGDLPAHRGHRRAAPFHGGRETRVLQPTTSRRSTTALDATTGRAVDRWCTRGRMRRGSGRRQGRCPLALAAEAGWFAPAGFAVARWRAGLGRQRRVAKLTSSALEPVRSPPDDDGCAV